MKTLATRFALLLALVSWACGSTSEPGDGADSPPDAASSPADAEPGPPDAEPGSPDAGMADAEVPIDAAPPDAMPEPVLELRARGRYRMPFAADVAASPGGTFVAVCAYYNIPELHIVDVTDPDQPTRITVIEDRPCADVQFKGNLLYVNDETSDVGIHIYDMADPADPVFLGSVGPAAGTNSLADCHNLWPQVDRELLYCASTATGRLVVLSTGEGGVGTPTRPAFLKDLRSPNSGGAIHDMHAVGNRLYASFLRGGMAIYDITDATDPVLLGTKTYSEMFNHSIWPTASGEYAITTDERSAGHMRVWDIRDPTDIVEVADYQPDPNTIVHNIEVVDDIAYISHYGAGFHVVDVADPRNPEVIGFDDFIPASESRGFSGAWGVDPIGDMIYVSDTTSGLRIYQLTSEP